MPKTYQTTAASRATDELMLPDTVTLAMADLADTVKEGLLALAVGAGLGVMQVMMQESVTAVCGPKGIHDPNRSAVRHGTEAGSVTLGGRRVPVRRPRVRSADGASEVPVPAYEVFASTEMLGADLSGLDLVALMIDGVHFADHLCVVALGIGIDGTKHPLGVVEGDTENTTVVKDLLVGLRERGLDTTRPILCVLDGAKALVAAVKAVFDHPVVHRCQLHYAERWIMPSRRRSPFPDKDFVLLKSA